MKSNVGLIVAVVFLAGVAALLWNIVTSEPPIPEPLSGSAAVDESGAPVQGPALQTGADKAAQESSERPAPPGPDPSNEKPTEPTAERARAIRGRVADVRGNPVANARVNAFSGTTARSTTSLDNGSFEFLDLPAGAYALEATKPEYASARREAVPAGSVDIALVLEETNAVAGTVLSGSTGTPLRAFEVAFGAAPSDDAPTSQWLRRLVWQPVRDPQGRFRLDGVPGEVTLLVAARAERHAAAWVILPAAARGQPHDEAVIHLPPGAYVEGEVITAAGGTVEGASVYVGDKPAHEPVAQTDADGHFSITTLAADDTLLTADHPDYVAGSTEIAPRPGATIQAQIVLDQGGVIEGMVRAGQEPVAGHVVEVKVPGGFPRRPLSARTGPEGRYTIVDVPAGEVNVRTTIPSDGPGSSRFVTERALVESGQVTVVDFDFSAVSAAIEGYVLIDGRPARQGWVAIAVSGELGQDSYTAPLQANGYYRADNLLPGSATVLASAEDGHGVRRRKTLDLEVAQGEIIRQDFFFEQAATVYGVLGGLSEDEQGTVFAVTGKPDVLNVTSLEGLLNFQNLIAATTEVDPEGRFQLYGLDPGVYTVVGVAVAAGASETLEDREQIRTTGRVVNVQGNTALEVNLTVR